MIYGAILDGRIAWREAQRQHAVCGLLCGGSCGASALWLLSPPPLMRTRLSRLPRWDFIVVEGSQTIVGRPIREEHAPEEQEK